ncbi:hypothetical protein PQ478_09120 [Alkalihalophilus pseudofirmus]|uniref:hypothetical protein n=1 Tax=Alkalihalophilus pseudofirmus TaxID=79885 RepID=UPI00259BE960|nr:hypothetical protein [Alkalihalophilus pseudofirmus]WEG18631.1 hypothetical protein PQ478_09120 [Alkalihalophilus pseudofirmus]
MAENTNTLRQAENQVHIEGILLENRLEEKEINGKPAITGEVDIEIKENEVHTVNFFSYKFKKDSNEESGLYKGLATVMNEYQSVNKVGAEAADKVRITTGNIGLNEYYTPDGQLRTFPQISSSFINRVGAGEEFTPKAEFRAEVIVAAVKEEYKNEQETGRAILDAYLPLYGGKIVPFTFVVGEDGAEYVQDNYEKGQTVKVWGNIVNFKEIVEKKTEGAFGNADKQIKTNTVREYVVTGGSEPYDEDNVNTYKVDVIKKALTEREVHLEQLKNKKKDNKGSKPSGGAKTGFETKPNKKPVEIDDNDLPF